MLPILPFATTVVLVLSPGVTTLAQGNSCGACNCQFSNVDLLIDLIREEINSTISEQLYGLWTPTLVNLEHIHVGSHVLETAATRSYSIPGIVPDTSREVLFTASASCRLDGGPVNSFVQYYVEIDGVRYVKLLYLVKSEGQSLTEGINTNSDNIWLPMPPNRLVYIRTTVAFPSCVAGIELIGYR